MQCFESSLMREYLFELVRETSPAAIRDDLRLDEVLEERGVHGMGALLALDADALAALARALADELPLAA